MTSFPKGWFFIKNLNNGYVLSTEKSTAGEPVVIASIRNRDFDAQLWQYGEDGRLHNKLTGFVLDVSKGSTKAGAEIVQQNDSDSSESQTFGMSSDGHIFLRKDPSLVLGIKESFFTRREGQHVHLQAIDKNRKDRKEQRWDFILPSQKRPTSGNNPIDSLKRTISGASLGSFTGSSMHAHDEEGCLDESHQLTNFPSTEFLIKSDTTGYFVGVDATASNSPGARLSLEPLRKTNYETQLWHYDAITGRLINKSSGFNLSAEELSDESVVCQSSSTSEKDLIYQSWYLTSEGEIKLKHEQSSFVLGFKKDSWFGLNREGAPVLLQKQLDGKTHSHHRFVIVLPVFKKKTTEIVTVTEQQGVFPEGYFFIKNQKHGLVITVLETEKLAAQVISSVLDTKNYNRQLWKFSNGFLYNKASNLVLDVRGGCITDGSEICQYKQKKENFENQQWGLSVEGYIHNKTQKNIVLSISSSKKTDSPVYLANKKTPDHEEQRWNFVLPVFKQKSTTVTETTVQKSVCYHHYAQYPSGWFFIRSFVGGSSTDSPYVITAENNSAKVSLARISKEHWRNQLWMYWNGVLINFATQLAMDVVNDDINSGSLISQEIRKAGDIGQRWSLTIDGYLVHGSNPALTLAPELVSEGNYKLALANHISSSRTEERWGLLTPDIKLENNVQVLVRWSVTLLTEWKKFSEQHIQRVIHSVANWPEETFFISAQDGLALAPEKSEAFSFVVVKKFEYGQGEHFKWTFRNGYLVHVATGLVLHASDDLVGGSQLLIREELRSDSHTIDQRQKWLVKTDGSIVSELKTNLGFALIQQGNQYSVQLAYESQTSEHYSWGFLHGHTESRYSEVYKKKVNVISRTERILLIIRTQQQIQSSKANTKLVTHTYGVFPENWFYIRSKADKSLVLTAPSRKKGEKLTLTKLDLKNFRRQLWHTQDDGCLINLESDFVIDVAGGAINDGTDIIQWNEKYLRRNRKNQVWGLSTEGHLHPKARPGLVLAAKNNKVFEGVELQLQKRGTLDSEYQLWTFATPVFGRSISGVKGVSAAGVLEKNDDSVFVESVSETVFETSTTDRYERTTKLTVVRRWGLFPDGGFFIRAAYGDEHLALTVEKRARTDERGRTEHEVVLRPIDFKEYKWHFWTYTEGHLINMQTGLALDSTFVKGLLIEDGLRAPLFVREKSMSEAQFWSLTADGEIFLRSDEHLVIGASNSRRVSTAGAQVGLRELRVKKFLNEQGQQETLLKSEKWLKWVFSKPVYRTQTTTTTTTSSSVVTSEESSVSKASEIVEGIKDEELGVKQKEESADDYSVDDDDDSMYADSSSSEDEGDESKLSLISNLGIATAGAGILAGTAGMISNVITSAPETIASAISGKKNSKTQEEEKVKQSLIKKTSYECLKFDRKSSFHLDANYVPTGFEKVVRYKTHQQPNFPSSGYFMIKSHLHGFVLDVANGDIKDGAFVVLAPIRTTDFASQLWSYKDGRVFNLKGHNLVLDASMTDTIVAGERLVISVQKSSLGLSDQYWEFGTEGGLISLKSKRNLVLGVKELKRVTDKSSTIDVYVQEEKSHLKSNFGRPEQRWEIKVPALIPMEQTTNTTSESKYTIIEGGKISAISSSISAIIAFKWLKETFHHKITADNQWPSSQNWFFIRIGNQNSFLSAGATDSSEIKLVALGKEEDHKQFLWVYVNGYLVNYKYMLRLVYNEESKKLLLSSDSKTLDQVLSISRQGTLSFKTHTKTLYLNVVSKQTDIYEFSASEELSSNTDEYSIQLHVPTFSSVEMEKELRIASSAVISWIQTSQKITETTILTTTTTTTTITKTSQQYGVFPVGTWFFIKAVSKGDDSLVLAVKESSSKAGASLVLKKLNFKDYRSQLWTSTNGLLINYGSKLVIDVSGEIKEFSKLVQSAEAGVSTQKWSLSATGRIQLDSYAHLTFGYTQSEKLTEDIHVVLVTAKETYEESSTTQAINWRFSVPVFGKATSTTLTSINASAIERITSYIEQGATIESVEEADIKVEDISMKKNNAASNTGSSSSIAVVTDKKHHGFQDILVNAGIAVTAGAVAVGVVEGASKIADKLTQNKQQNQTAEEVKSSTESTTTKTDVDETTLSSSKSSTMESKSSTTSSAVTDMDKISETVAIHRTKRTSVQIIEESRTIVYAWRVVFNQRIHQCKTKQELIQTIEESREDLFRRLDEHLRMHATIDYLISGAVPDWHVSIQEVKELYRARVFEKFLDRLNHKEANDLASIDFEATMISVTEEVENHYKLIIQEQSSKIPSDKEKTQQQEESAVKKSIITTIDTIKVTVRYWLIDVYETISLAKSKGSSEEEIKSLIEESRSEITKKLSEIKTSACEHLEASSSSSTSLASKKLSIDQTIKAAICEAETIVKNQVSAICSHSSKIEKEEHWLEIVRITEETLSIKLKVYQTAITQELAEVEKTETSTTDKAEISIVLDEKMVSVAQQAVSNKLVETQVKLSSWYIEVSQQISWLLQQHQGKHLEESVKQDTLAILNAAHVEISTRIKETKLVLRTYYAHLTYLSWAERRRIEYALDGVLASLTANITQFKHSVEKSTATKEQIIRYSSISFGTTASRIVVSEMQNMITKVTNIKETTTVINKTDEINSEKTKIAISAGTVAAGTITKVTADVLQQGNKADITKVEQTKKTEVDQSKTATKVTGTIESEVEETKIINKVENAQQQGPSTSQSKVEASTGSGHSTAVSSAVIGAAAAAVASAAIIHQHESATEQQGSVKTDVTISAPATAIVVEKPSTANVVVGGKSQVLHVNESKTTDVKQEKSQTLVVVYDQVQVIVHEWFASLSKRVSECAQKKSKHEEIDAIILESQQQLIVEIEKAKRKTTAIIGTSQTSFHDTLSWVRTTVWKETVEIKRIGYEIASSTETEYAHFEEKLNSLKVSVLEKVDLAIEESKKSATSINVVGHEHTAVIAAGKKFEGVDYSKTSQGELIESTKVTVGVLMETTRVTVQQLLHELSSSITECHKQHADSTQISLTVDTYRQKITQVISESKKEFEHQVTTIHQSTKTDTELTSETIKKVNSTLEQIQDSIMIQVTKVQDVAVSTTVETEYNEKLTAVTVEACEKLDATLTVSETIIGHHVEVTAVSHKTDQSVSVSLGAEYGLLVVSETTQQVSSQISALVERVHHCITASTESLETDVYGYAITSEKELDLIIEQAKTKVTHELSMVSASEKVEEKHFIASLEAIRTSAKTRISQIQTVATVHKEESKTVTEKLLQIAEESRHEVAGHYTDIKQTVVQKTEKISHVIHDTVSHEATTPIARPHQQQEHHEEQKSSMDLAKKVLLGSAAVAAGTAIAVEVAKKLSEHKEKTEQIEQAHKQTVVVIEDIKVQFTKWISSLTETIVTQSKQSGVTTEQISATVEKSKTEFIEIIKQAQSNTAVSSKHQHQILTWLEATTVAQASRIQEIAISSTSSAAIDIESKLEVIKVSTSQEVESALEKCKHTKESSAEFIGVTVEQLKQKEAALLDVRSELVIVIQDVKSSLVTYFQQFSKTVVDRLKQGGDNVEKEIAILVTSARKELTSHIESVKNTATKRLSTLETKFTTSVISTAALSGIATAEIIAVIKSSEELLVQKINRVHSCVWYMQKNQDVTKIVESITSISSETVTEITEKVESTKYGFVTAINEHHKTGEVPTKVEDNKSSSEQQVVVLKASLSVQEIKITIREWLRSLAEKVSICSQKGGSSEEIEVIVTSEQKIIFEYLDQSVSKISEIVKSEESTKYLHSTVQEVKTAITKTSTEIKSIGVESISHSYGGFDKMTTIITQHEQKISEIIVVYETKVAPKKSEATVPKKQQESGSMSTVVSKTAYTVVAVDYIISVTHSWLEELMIEVSDYCKYEHNIDVLTKETASIVADYKEYLSIEFNLITERIRSSKVDTSVKQELINILEWTRGMVLQSSTQIQSIGINCGVSFSTTGGIEQMKPLVSATETQISVAVGRCSKTVKIEVERTTTHADKKKAKCEVRKQALKKKADCAAAEKKKKTEAYEKKQDKAKKSESGADYYYDSGSDCSYSSSDCEDDSRRHSSAKKKKQDCDDKNKKSSSKKKLNKHSSSEDDSCSEDEKKSKKKKAAAGIIAIGGGIAAGKIIKSKYDQSSSSGSDTQTDSEDEVTTVVDKKKLVNGAYSFEITLVVREWYEKLILDVSTRSKKGGVTAGAEIEAIVRKATTSLIETLRIITVNAHKTVTKDVVQYKASIEWVKNLVIQSSLQIQAIAINSVAMYSKTGGIEQMRPIAISIQEQVDVEIRRYKLTIVETQKKPAFNAIENQKNNEKICLGRKSASERKEYYQKLEQHISEVVAESKVVIISWFAQFVRDVSICIHQSDSNSQKDISVLIEKSKAHLESTIEQVRYKLTSTIHEEDKTLTLIEYQIQQGLHVIQSTLNSKITEIKQIAAEHHSESEISEKLSVVLEKSKLSITETLDSTHTQSVTVIHQETKQTESTVTIIETVESVKTTVTLWHSKLLKDIETIQVDNVSTEEKEHRITALIEQAIAEVQRTTIEAKSKLSQECSSIKKMSKTKEQELISSIDYAHETFSSDIKKIQEVSLQAIKKSDTSIKQSVSTIIQESHQKIDSALNGTTAAIVGFTAAIVAKKDQVKTEEKDKLSLDVEENVSVISRWFEVFSKRVSTSVQHASKEEVVQNVTKVTEQAEQEITEIISTARSDFVKRLSLQNMDQASFNYACKHYEESLESVRISIVTEIVEIKKVAIHAHSTSNIQELEIKLTELTKTSQERIKVAMGSSVVISHKTQPTLNNEAVLHIEVKDEDAIVVGEQDVEFGRVEGSIEKVETKKTDSNIEKILAGTLAAGAAAAGAAVIGSKKSDKEDKPSKTLTSIQNLKYDSGITTIESINISISIWFTALVQRVSTASRYGASAKKITLIVEESRSELTQIIEHAKITGGKYCASIGDEQQFISKIEWVSSVAHNQAIQIQQIGINASTGKADLTSQMEALTNATYHQIQVTLDQLKQTVKFHQKINKISSSTTTQVETTKPSGKPTTVTDNKPVCGKMPTAVDKTKVAYTVIQETRVTTIALFLSLSESIITRIRQGGSNVQEDVTKIIDSSQQEITKVFLEAKSSSSKYDKKTRLEIEEALVCVHKTVQQQITEVKTVTIQAVSSGETETKLVVDKVTQVSKSSKSKIEDVFISVSETITASLTIVTQTAQEAAETVQSWFSDLRSKIDALLEASDCTEEETQTKINTVVAEAEVEMKTKIEKLQQTSTLTKKTSSSSTTQVTTDHHLDIFFGNMKSTVKTQLDAVKTAVQNTSNIDKHKITSTLEITENKLKQEVNNHYQAVESITTVDHITGNKQQTVDTEKDRHDTYKDTIVKTAIGASAVAAAAAIAIDHYNKTQKQHTTAVQVVKETSIQQVQEQIDIWFVQLTEKLVECTKKQKDSEVISIEVDKIVQEAQSQLEITINEAKATHVTETYVSESKRTFTSTLEWIKTTVYSQSSQVASIVKQGSTSSISLSTQIENHIMATKQQVDTALEVHYKKDTSQVVVIDQSKKKTQSDSSTSKKQEGLDKKTMENIVTVVKETRQQTEKRFSLETTVIVQERKTKITSWLVILLESITSIIHSNSETIRKDIFARLDTAEKDVEEFIRETKEKFLLISKTTTTSHEVEAETQKLVVNSVKQTLDCVDSLRSTLVLQISVLREVINRIDVEDIDVITERLEAIIRRTQQRVQHTLEVGIDLAIHAAFEGQVVTWSETAKVPNSFKNVRVIAFDVAGTVANYRKTLYEVWKQVITPKNEVALISVDFNEFVQHWYSSYAEVKQTNFAKKRPVSDDISLHESLVLTLKQHYIKDFFTEAEIEQLCEAWRNLAVYDDASIGIRRLKNQAFAKYATVAISDTLSTRSMVDLAQNNCLCWHGLFTAEMFAMSSSGTASESTVKGTINLLGLQNASELAIVSTSAELVATAKKQGCHTVFIERQELIKEKTSVECDIRVNGLDIFGESVQTFLEHESMVKVWSTKSAPSTPPLLVQQLKNTCA